MSCYKRVNDVLPLVTLSNYVPQCYGADVSHTMIEIALKCLPKQVEERSTRSGRIDFPDAFLDFAFSYAVFQHVSRKSDICKAIKDISRVLKKGGRVKLQFDMVFPYPPGFTRGKYLPLRISRLCMDGLNYFDCSCGQ
jgi:ubiquinone/menaquinone biosynthesis C-methylase UbiE